MTISTGDTGCNFATQGHVQWRLTIGGVDQRMCGGVLTTGSWHHVAATYNGQKAQLYVDGSLVASASRSGAIAVSSADLFLGNRSDATRGYEGDLDSVSIWSRALSSAEILAHQTPSLSGSESGLALTTSSTRVPARRSATRARKATPGCSEPRHRWKATIRSGALAAARREPRRPSGVGSAAADRAPAP
jgi:hypothetical protein